MKRHAYRFFVFLGFFLSSVCLAQPEVSLKKLIEFSPAQGVSFPPIALQLRDFSFRDHTINADVETQAFKDSGLLYLTLNAHDISINDIPLDEISSQVIIRKTGISLSYFQARGFSATGDFIFGEQTGRNSFDLNLEVAIKGVDAQTVNTLFFSHSTMKLQGNLRGKIQIKGKTDDLFLRGELEIVDGALAEFVFKRLVLYFEGTYPYLRIFNSYAFSEDGTKFLLDGYCNLASFDAAQMQKIRREDDFTRFDFLSQQDQFHSFETGGVYSLDSLINRPFEGGREFIWNLGEEKLIQFRIQEEKERSALTGRIHF